MLGISNKVKNVHCVVQLVWSLRRRLEQGILHDVVDTVGTPVLQRLREGPALVPSIPLLFRPIRQNFLEES